MKALAIVGVNLRRLLRWRANVFFLLVLPMLIILLLGAAFGGSDARLGVATGSGGPLAGQLVAALDAEPNLTVERFASEQELESAVERGLVEAGLVLPANYDAAARSGAAVRLRYFARPDSLAQQLRVAVEAAVDGQAGLIRTARFLRSQRLASFDEGLQQAGLVAAAVPRVDVRVTDPSGAAYPNAEGRFEGGASTQLLLFIFFTSLTGAGALIETRRLGVSRRMLSTPTSLWTVLLGEGLGRFAIAIVQALIIMIGSTLLFGVSWGDPIAAALLVLTFCLVGSGAGLLLGSVLENEQQALALSLLLGLGLAALGGSMVPLEVFPHTMRLIAYATPHSWANDAFDRLLQHGAGVTDVLSDLAVLGAYAVVLLAAATWLLRRKLTT